MVRTINDNPLGHPFHKVLSSSDNGPETGTLLFRSNEHRHRSNRRQRHLHRPRHHRWTHRTLRRHRLDNRRRSGNGPSHGLRLLQLLCPKRGRTLRPRHQGLRQVLGLHRRMEHVHRRNSRTPSLRHRLHKLPTILHPTNRTSPVPSQNPLRPRNNRHQPSRSQASRPNQRRPNNGKTRPTGPNHPTQPRCVRHQPNPSGQLLPPRTYGIDNFGTAFVLIFWAYAGFELGSLPASEVKDPKKTIPRAVIRYSFMSLANARRLRSGPWPKWLREKVVRLARQKKTTGQIIRQILGDYHIAVRAPNVRRYLNTSQQTTKCSC